MSEVYTVRLTDRQGSLDKVDGDVYIGTLDRVEKQIGETERVSKPRAELPAICLSELRKIMKRYPEAQAEIEAVEIRFQYRDRR